MTIDVSPALTAEELNSLVDLAVLTPSPRTRALHLTRLMTADGAQVTGDCLTGITEEP